MSLATIIVLCLAVLFFGGIIYLDYLGRKESKPGEPVRLVPQEQPAASGRPARVGDPRPHGFSLSEQAGWGSNGCGGGCKGSRSPCPPKSTSQTIPT